MNTKTLLYFLIILSFSLKSQSQVKVESTLETVTIENGKRTIIHSEKFLFEAPNWTPDGNYFIINSEGKLYKVPVTGGGMELINTGLAIKCNNDHGISPDGTMLVVSHNDSKNPEVHNSSIYTLPINGGIPKLITEKSPSYWHGWSPDGKTLVYCAERNGEYDVYSIPVEGGEEKRMTSAKGLDDGPEYSPDGKYIYFNSFRTGKMQIWKMEADGSNQEQITTDKYSNWFAHPSPDGNWIIFISYIEDQGSQHPANKDVMLRLMSLKDGKITELVKLFGGQGTINVPSWSPDSKQVAFVSYKLL